jgi:hypothetical protein
MPRGKYERKKPVIESNAVFSGSEQTIDLAKVAKDGAPEIAVVGENVLADTEKIERHRFMNEELEVYINDPQGDNENKFCQHCPMKHP